jgi:ribosomal protein S18 acetylase RimI-like enzyme
MARSTDTAAPALEKLKRESAGRYVTGDGRFSVEQSSGRWLTIDAETTDELGLPLVRGPFATLDEARAAIVEARTAPKATSTLAARLKAVPAGQGRTRGHGAKAAVAATKKAREPIIALRDFQSADGDPLRSLWKAAGFRSDGDDDRSLAAFAARNPGLLVVATADDVVIGSALGGWDGRRGWIYHVVMAESFRRKGIATRLVRRVEQRLRVAGAPKVNVIVRDEDERAPAFWQALGYALAPSPRFNRKL